MVSANENVLAIRGTEFDNSLPELLFAFLPGVALPEQTVLDLFAADFEEIVGLGIAIGQATSLVNYVLRHAAPAGAPVPQYTLERLTSFDFAPTPVPAGAPSFSVGSAGPGGARTWYWLTASIDAGTGLLSSAAPLTVVGHSLGGHLAALALRLFPQLFEQGVVFNVAGFDAPASRRLTEAFVRLVTPLLPAPPAANFAGFGPRLRNYVSESSGTGDDLSVVPSVLTGIAALPPVETIRTEHNSHGMDPLMDDLAVLALLERLAPALERSDLYRAFDAASSRAGGSVEFLVGALGRLLLPTAPLLGEVASGWLGYSGEVSVFSRRSEVQDTVLAMTAVLAAQSGLRLEPLLDLSASTLIARARTSVAYRYAVREYLPFALVGNDALYARHNAQGVLDTHAMTLSELADRVQMYQHEMNRRLGDLSDGYALGDDALRFTDLRLDFTFLVRGILPEAQPDTQGNVVIGSDGDDVSGAAAGSPLRDRLHGAGGHDRLAGGVGADYLDGGAGDDVLEGGLHGDTLEGGDGHDTLYGTAATGADDGSGDVLIGGAGFDRLFAGPGDIVIDTDGALHVRVGDEWVAVAGRPYRELHGSETVRVLRSDDAAGLILAYNLAARELRVGGVTVSGFVPGDLGLTLQASTPPLPALPLLRGTATPDQLVGGSAPERIEGLAGDDVLRGGGGADQVFGGDGQDALSGDAGDDRLEGGAARDSLLGGDGRDVLLGQDGDDALAGGAGDDILDGGSGHDVIGGGGGRDTLVGGDGDDLLSAELQFEHPDLAWRIERYGPAVGQRLRDPRSVVLSGFNTFNVDALNQPQDGSGDLLYGGAGADFLFGSAGADFIDGGPGADTALGGDGADVMHGGAGDDHLRGNGGADVLDGGDGDDFLVGHGSGNEGLDEDGADRLSGGAGDDELHGGPGDDVLIGDAGADRLFAGDGDDTLAGGEGDDALIGDAGRDALDGGDGDDRLFGDRGQDVLDGGAGADYLDGGDDNDHLRGGAQADQLLGGSGADTLLGDSGDDILKGGADGDLLDGGAGDDTLDGGAGNDVYQAGANAGHDVIHDVAGLDELQLTAVRAASALRITEAGEDLLLAWDEHSSVRIRDWRSGTVDRLRLGPSLVLDRAHFLTPERAGRVRLLSDTPGTAPASGLVGTHGDDDLLLDTSAGTITAGEGNDRYLMPAEATAVVLGIDDMQGSNTLQFQRGVGLQDIALALNGEAYVLTVAQHQLTVSPASIARYAFADGSTLDAAEFRQHVLHRVPIAPRLMQPLDNQAVYLGQAFQFGLPAGTFVDLNPGPPLRYAASLDNGNALPGWLHFDATRGVFSGQPPGAASGSYVVRVTATDERGLSAQDQFGLDVLPTLQRAPGAVFAHEWVNGVNGFWLSSAVDDGSTTPAPLLAAAGDLNGDGYDDFILGDTVRFGRARGFGSQLGPPTLDGYDSFQLQHYVSDGFRYADSGLLPRTGDFNRDGLADLLLPAPDGQSPARVIYGHRGRFAATIDYLKLPEMALPPPAQLPLLIFEGRVVTAADAREAGDVNGDGRPDLIVTVAGDTAARTWRGVVFGPDPAQPAPVYLDAANGRNALRILADAYSGYPYTEPDGALATSGWGPLLPLGDINDDGLADIGLGSAPFLFQRQPVFGAAIFGRADGHGGAVYLSALNGANGFLTTFPAPSTAYSAAHLLRAAGDLNGDGYDDLFAVDDATGAAYAVYGRAAFSGAMHAGTAGNDTLTVQADSVVHAGPGDDTLLVPMTLSGALFGGSGQNVFIFAFDAGQLAGRRLHRIDVQGGMHEDTYVVLGSRLVALYIRDGVGAPNYLKFGAAMSSFNFVLRQGSVVLDFGAEGPQIHLEDVDLDNVLGGARTIDRIEFADGRVLSYEDLIARGFDVPGTAFDEALRGSSVVDRITALAGHDLLAGGRGNDILDGGTGDDLYVQERGDGRDLIRDEAGRDRVRFGAGITPADLSFEQAGDDLIVHYGSGDALRITGWHHLREARIETFQFADSSLRDAQRLANRAPVATTPALNLPFDAGGAFSLPLSSGWFRDPDPLDWLGWRVSADVAAGTASMPGWLRFDRRTRSLTGTPPVDFVGDIHLRVTAVDPSSASASLGLRLRIGRGVVRTGTRGDDRLAGTVWSDELRGGSGHDQLSGFDNHDALFGDHGNDTLNGGAGNDRLTGGAGADVLSGEGGSDRYLFARGSGSDRIVNRDTAGFDEIVFADAGVPADLWFSRQGTDLDIARSGSADTIRVAGWYASSPDRVDRIAYADGAAVLAADVDRLVEAMAHYGAVPAPGAIFAPMVASPLAPALAAAWRS